jgi:hypothetical protein
MVEGDVRPLAGEGEADLATQALPGAGHEHHAAGELEVRQLASLSSVTSSETDFCASPKSITVLGL